MHIDYEKVLIQIQLSEVKRRFSFNLIAWVHTTESVVYI